MLQNHKNMTHLTNITIQNYKIGEEKMFIRIKIITAKNGNKYAYFYLVKSIHTKKGARQKVVKYLGRAEYVGVLRKEDIQILFKRYNYKCALCFSQEDLTIDHIIPLIKGGTNDLSNLQILCRYCNLRKRDLVYHIPMFKRKPQIENLMCIKN